VNLKRKFVVYMVRIMKLIDPNDNIVKLVSFTIS
jgi:hypothetical protein